MFKLRNLKFIYIEYLVANITCPFLENSWTKQSRKQGLLLAWSGWGCIRLEEANGRHLVPHKTPVLGGSWVERCQKSCPSRSNWGYRQGIPTQRSILMTTLSGPQRNTFLHLLGLSLTKTQSLTTHCQWRCENWNSHTPWWEHSHHGTIHLRVWYIPF